MTLRTTSRAISTRHRMIRRYKVMLDRLFNPFTVDLQPGYRD
jgi:hypothetical protein